MASHTKYQGNILTCLHIVITECRVTSFQASLTTFYYALLSEGGHVVVNGVSRYGGALVSIGS